jgi:hypothetical protein
VQSHIQINEYRDRVVLVYISSQIPEFVCIIFLLKNDEMQHLKMLYASPKNIHLIIKFLKLKQNIQLNFRRDVFHLRMFVQNALIDMSNLSGLPSGQIDQSNMNLLSANT